MSSKLRQITDDMGEQVNKVKNRLRDQENESQRKLAVLNAQIQALNERNSKINNELQNQIDENLELQEKQLKTT